MQVRISKPAKSAMQSANSKNSWQLEFIRKDNSQFKENTMGRTSSRDMANEIKISFSTMQEAINFAKKENYSYEIIMPKPEKIQKKSYTSNFH